MTHGTMRTSKKKWREPSPPTCGIQPFVILSTPTRCELGVWGYMLLPLVVALVYRPVDPQSSALLHQEFISCWILAVRTQSGCELVPCLVVRDKTPGEQGKQAALRCLIVSWEGFHILLFFSLNWQKVQVQVCSLNGLKLPQVLLICCVNKHVAFCFIYISLWFKKTYTSGSLQTGNCLNS